MEAPRHHSRNEFSPTRLNFLYKVHLPIQRIVVFFVGPSVFVIYSIFTYFRPCWQNGAILAGLALLNISWSTALWLFKAKRLSASVTLFVCSTIALTTLVGTLTTGFLVVVLMSNLGVTIYAALFSRRHTYLGSAGVIVSYLICELFLQFRPVETMVVEGIDRFIIGTLVGLIVLPVITGFLRRNQSTNEGLIDATEKLNLRQSEIIDAVASLQPVMDEAVQKIQQISGQFTLQANEQAASVVEVNATVSEVNATSAQTAAAASETQRVAEKMSKGAQKSSEKLAEVERGFKSAVEIIGNAHNKVDSLVTRVVSIEEILGFNIEISAQIKILAINAAIQAAKAGRYGLGFRVVANELRQMIHSTEENLSKSQLMLEEIRQDAKESLAEIQSGFARVDFNFSALSDTGAMIGSSADNYRQTAKQVAKMAGAAREQDVGMRGINTAMTQIDQAAGQLSNSAETLIDVVEKVARFQNLLQKALDRPLETEPAVK